MTTEASGLPITIVLNKSDLVGERRLGELQSTLRSWGYEPLCVSTKLQQGLEQVAEALKGKTSVLAGKNLCGSSGRASWQGLSCPFTRPHRPLGRRQVLGDQRPPHIGSQAARLGPRTGRIRTQGCARGGGVLCSAPA